MVFKQKVLLGDHPEINHFYDDVACLKHGGSPSKGCPVCAQRLKQKKARQASKTKKTKGSTLKETPYEKIAHMNRLIAPPALSMFANAPDVQRPSYFAVPPAVGQSYHHAPPRYTVEMPTKADVDRRHASTVTQQADDPANRSNLRPVDSYAQRAIATSSEKSGGVMSSDPRILASEARRLTADYSDKTPAHDVMEEPWSEMVHPASHNYFPPTGAPGNHPSPKQAQHDAPRSGFEPLEAQHAPSREHIEEMQRHISSISRLPKSQYITARRKIRSEIMNNPGLRDEDKAEMLREYETAGVERKRIERIETKNKKRAQEAEEPEEKYADEPAAAAVALKHGGRKMHIRAYAGRPCGSVF